LLMETTNPDMLNKMIAAIKPYYTLKTTTHYRPYVEHNIRYAMRKAKLMAFLLTEHFAMKTVTSTTL